jgi:H+/Cl- antiporter ClcA
MMENKTEKTQRPSIDALQTDIGFANTYRLEVIKTVLGIATALLAFTISFRPKLSTVQYEWMMQVSWIALATSIIAGIVTMYCWELFYISYRNKDWKGHGPAGKNLRKKITRFRRLFFTLEIAGCLLGVVGVAYFSVVNLPYAAP